MVDDTVLAGVAAWSRIRESGRKNFDDWITVAKALAKGRAEAMATAKANQPLGSRYNAAFGAWLRGNGLDGIDNQARYKALLVLENLDSIEAFRATLPETKRERVNHPGAIWSHFRRATGAAPGASAPKRRAKSRAAKPAPIRRQIVERVPHPDQDTLRRIAAELREHWTTDVYKLALVAYHAVIRPAPPPLPKPASADTHVAA